MAVRLKEASGLAEVLCNMIPVRAKSTHQVHQGAPSIGHLPHQPVVIQVQHLCSRFRGFAPFWNSNGLGRVGRVWHAAHDRRCVCRQQTRGVAPMRPNDLEAGQGAEIWGQRAGELVA